MRNKTRRQIFRVGVCPGGQETQEIESGPSQCFDPVKAASVRQLPGGPLNRCRLLIVRLRKIEEGFSTAAIAGEQSMQFDSTQWILREFRRAERSR